MLLRMVIPFLTVALVAGAVCPCCTATAADGSDSPLGEWPEFVPIGFITDLHPDYPEVQTHLCGDWGGIVRCRATSLLVTSST